MVETTLKTAGIITDVGTAHKTNKQYDVVLLFHKKHVLL